ncbi:hypothetical protein RM844_20315 [Streptomyces sp. DSM 44915]|uniref:Integral membrane protein n=1 Tax=Streptomyces chisholmiae TaxID=3075540 RepID=A0ABU2JV58_9ACTN|nr:hypothetical protein [Streptomyces sp. DSM 44915]MDT0268633.1 hypothetical protein [Streptomyces sp. DSM 44915]
MSHQQSTPPPPRPPGVSAGYQRWAGALVRLAVGLGVLVAVALVVSFVLLARADADQDRAAEGYLAMFLWFGIVAVTPVLLAAGIVGRAMRERVRRTRSAGGQPSSDGHPR